MLPRSFACATALAAYAAVCTGCLARNHIQHEGPYLFTAQQVLGNNCGLRADSSGLWSGVMLITGDLIHMQMDEGLYGMEAEGYFLYGVEQFTLDGTAPDIANQVSGLPCEVDRAQAHVDAITDSSTTFHGSARVEPHSEQRAI